MKAKNTGFTLIEVLVVIAITGFVAVLVLQMLTILLRGNDQIARVQTQMNEQVLSQAWFRDSIGVMMASLDEEFAFKGDERSVSGYTLSPLLGHAGEITPVQWTLRRSSDGDALWYSESGEAAIRIANWPDTLAKFSFRGQKSGWLEQWPSGDLTSGVLPYRVKLSLASNDQIRDVFAAVRVRRSGRYDYRDFLE